MQIGDYVRITGPLALAFPGQFAVTARVSPGMYALDNGENFHMKFLQKLPDTVSYAPVRTAMPVELVIQRLPMPVWKSLKAVSDAGDATVRAGLRKLYNSDTINLNANATFNWVAYCVTNNFLTQVQADLLLA